MEGKTAGELLNKELWRAKIHEWARDVQVEFATTLQRCHDQGVEPEQMKRSFVFFARDWGIDVEALGLTPLVGIVNYSTEAKKNYGGAP